MGSSHLGRVFVVALAIAMIAVMPVAAVHSVEELWEQGERQTAELTELRNSVEGMSKGFEDTINSTGVRLIMILTLEFIALNCFYYLLRLSWSYWNRHKLKRERDIYVDSLKAETELLKKKNFALEREANFLSEAHNHLLNIVSLIKPENPQNRFIMMSAISVLFIMFSFVIFQPQIEASADSTKDYFFAIPLVFAFMFFMVAFKFYRDDQKVFKSHQASQDIAEVTSISAPLVDVPPREDLTRVEQSAEPKPDKKRQGLLDILTHLKGEKTKAEKQAEAEAKKAEEEAKKSLQNLPEGAEIKVQNGLAQISVPIKESDFTIEKAREVMQKMDLPDIEDGVAERDAEESKGDVKVKVDRIALEKNVINVLASTKDALTVKQIVDRLGLKGKQYIIHVSTILMSLRKRGIVNRGVNADKKTIWIVVRKKN